MQGGGRSSAWETIGRVVVGAVAKKILELKAGTEVRHTNFSIAICINVLRLLV